jgi:hypothetical protein
MRKMMDFPALNTSSGGMVALLFAFPTHSGENGHGFAGSGAACCGGGNAQYRPSLHDSSGCDNRKLWQWSPREPVYSRATPCFERLLAAVELAPFMD